MNVSGVVGRPLQRLRARGVRAIEVRLHVLREQRVRTLGVLEVRPVVREHQIRAEIRDLLFEPLDLRDRVVRRADDAGAALDHRVDRILAFQVFGAHPVDRVEVAAPLLETELHLFARFFARLGDVHRADEAQPTRVHRAAVLGGGLLARLPS